ncbi:MULTISPECIES: hypothetical protein [Phenylobacterium]|uniref:Lipoprotein n=1 Tax=Phenylobacterium koreense TaxID=266125 RepID=A0ABV2EL78_9CAUL
MRRSTLHLAVALGSGALLAACDKPIDDGPFPPKESPTASATAPSPSEIPTTSGGPAGQTPPYGQPGAAPTEVTEQPDNTGVSASDSSGSVR